MSFLERFFQGWKVIGSKPSKSGFTVSPDFVAQLPNLQPHVPTNPLCHHYSGNTMQHHATPPSFRCEDTFFVVVQYVFVWCPIFVSLYPHCYCSNHPYSRKCACPIISLWYPPANPSMAKKEKSCLPIQKLLRFHQSKFLLWGIYHQNILNSIQVSNFFGHFNTFVVEILFSATTSNVKSLSHLGSSATRHIWPKKNPWWKVAWNLKTFFAGRTTLW